MSNACLVLLTQQNTDLIDEYNDLVTTNVSNKKITYETAPVFFSVAGYCLRSYNASGDIVHNTRHVDLNHELSVLDLLIDDLQRGPADSTYIYDVHSHLTEFLQYKLYKYKKKLNINSFLHTVNLYDYVYQTPNAQIKLELTCLDFGLIPQVKHFNTEKAIYKNHVEALKDELEYKLALLDALKSHVVG